MGGDTNLALIWQWQSSRICSKRCNDSQAAIRRLSCWLATIRHQEDQHRRLSLAGETAKRSGLSPPPAFRRWSDSLIG